MRPNSSVSSPDRRFLPERPRCILGRVVDDQHLDRRLHRHAHRKQAVQRTVEELTAAMPAYDERAPNTAFTSDNSRAARNRASPMLVPQPSLDGALQLRWLPYDGQVAPCSRSCVARRAQRRFFHCKCLSRQPGLPMRTRQLALRFAQEHAPAAEGRCGGSSATRWTG